MRVRNIYLGMRMPATHDTKEYHVADATRIGFTILLRESSWTYVSVAKNSSVSADAILPSMFYVRR